MTEPAVVKSVVRFLGFATLGLILAMFLLLRQVIAQGAGGGTIDAATLGAVTSVGTLVGACVGAMSAMLVSTRSTGGDVQPVEVVQGSNNPVPVEEVAEEAA